MDWLSLLKAPKILSDEGWMKLAQDIKADKMPANRDKYVKFSNLDSINKKMVVYYLGKGLTNPKHRMKYLEGIHEEMLRSSNARFDIEDKGGDASEV
tara:strand:- start:10 stop:300 length:291 start_codon:yes stop_codon:yes gene_type:complete